jgi:signal transduction histidine kinase/CheY-like chemotaxis protein
VTDTISDVSDLNNWIRVTLLFAAFAAGSTLAVRFMVSRLEQALRHSQELNAALEQETATRLEAARRQHELETQMQQAQKLESLGRLATGIAHDFNNMLLVIAGNAEAATEPTVSAEEREVARRDLSSALDQAAALTRQLLAFSKSRAVDRQTVDVRSRLLDVLGILRRVLPSSIRVVTEIDEELPTVNGSSTLVEQTLMNLAINARDAMPNGGMLTVRANIVRRTNPASVENGDGDYVALFVIDTGIGMDEQTRQRALDPFFTTKPIGQGTGFGLSVVHGLAQQSAGFVELASTPGEGTTVAVFLPVANVPTSDAPLRHADERPSEGEGRLVLVVEDDERIRRLIVRYLEQAGYRTLVAEDGQAGFELVKQRGAELTLVISDTAVPGLNGRALLDEIQRARPGMPVLICSGHATEFFEHGSFAGAQQMLLAKPFTREQLLGAAGTLCGSKGAAAPAVADTAPLAPS